MSINRREVEAMVAGYIEAVLFAEDHNDEPMDHNYYAEDVSDKTRSGILAECLEFIQQSGEFENQAEYRQAGRDFYFTRNGHGVGFWDRPEVYGEKRAEELTAIAESFREDYFFVADNGEIKRETD